MSFLERWKARVRQLKSETIALYLACRDPRVPWYAKALVIVVVGYALSPIDLIPDFIPILGYLDDLILVPLGIALAIRMIPSPVMSDCRERARGITAKPISHLAAAIIVAIWLAALALAVWLVLRAWLRWAQPAS